MRRLAIQDSRRPEIQAQAHSLGNALAVDRFLRDLWNIVPDPIDYEYIQAPALQLRLLMETGILRGDCDDAATLGASLLAALGWPCSLVAIRLPGEYDFSHVFLRCSFEGDRLDIDPIVPEYALPIAGVAEEMEISVV